MERVRRSIDSSYLGVYTSDSSACTSTIIAGGHKEKLGIFVEVIFISTAGTEAVTIAFVGNRVVGKE